tara:strand:+ start:57 stop:227 length:171 start_codon:yes stop_codon:yes gene_type:complete
MAGSKKKELKGKILLLQVELKRLLMHTKLIYRKEMTKRETIQRDNSIPLKMVKLDS